MAGRNDRNYRDFNEDRGSQSYDRDRDQRNSERDMDWERDRASEWRLGQRDWERNRPWDRDQGWDRGRGSDWRRDIELGYGDYGSRGRDSRESLYGHGSWTWDQNQWQPGLSSRGQWQGQEQRQGQFSGRGPKGFRRSDERIREEVCERLTDHPEIDASEIEVEAKSGEITLKGTVPERRMKRMAEDLIESISGVADVHNQLRVSSQAQEGAEQRSSSRTKAA